MWARGSHVAGVEVRQLCCLRSRSRPARTDRLGPRNGVAQAESHDMNWRFLAVVVAAVLTLGFAGGTDAQQAGAGGRNARRAKVAPQPAPSAGAEDATPNQDTSTSGDPFDAAAG